MWKKCVQQLCKCNRGEKTSRCAYPPYDKFARFERHFRQGVEHHAHLAVIEAGKQEVGPDSRLDARLHRYSSF
jgi:hypothetical protein